MTHLYRLRWPHAAMARFGVRFAPARSRLSAQIILQVVGFADTIVTDWLGVLQFEILWSESNADGNHKDHGCEH